MYLQKEYAMKLRRNGFNNCTLARALEVARNFLRFFFILSVSFKFPILSRANYSSVRRHWCDTTVFSFPYKFTCPWGNVEEARCGIKRYSSSKSRTTLRSQSRIKIIYTTFTHRAAHTRARARRPPFRATQFSVQFLANGRHLRACIG